ncbi:hypothetical protein AA13595_0774 [Gluconacetobacter johannae DSM 13595]|uniref:hypothetical protein n=1 Tax=Gluconacetobacter johannae TaxID=112140 RepID=UPI001601BCF8|nr:hypothetical protein [Gluconacetobacter johannae]GBQ81913.1 hypothetical protein AA13595_0774 [Gluconacetobacter johannae DSM 13595]
MNEVMDVIKGFGGSTRRGCWARMASCWGNAAGPTIEQRIVDHDAARGQKPACEPLSFLELAHDLKSVWQAPAADVRLKKRIVRTLVQEVGVFYYYIGYTISFRNENKMAAWRYAE